MRSRLLPPDPLSSALARLIAAVFEDEPFIVVFGGHDAARLQLLARAADELANLGCRVLCASAQPPDELGLDALVQQISDQSAPGDLLERSHLLLTEGDEQTERVVL